MGKTLIQQARGHGSLTFRIRPHAYIYRITYPRLDAKGKAKIVKLFNSAAHSAPLVKILIDKESFFSPACDGIYEGQEIMIDEKREGGKIETGDILKLKDIPVGTKICNIELSPGSGGKYMRSSGSCAVISGKEKDLQEEP